MKKLFFLFIMVALSTEMYATEPHFEYPQQSYLYSWQFPFCSKHLVEDPEGCSSWVMEEKDGKKECVLEENTDFYLFPYSYIDRNLIDQLGNDIFLIPSGDWCGCAHGKCNQCGEQLRLSVSISEKRGTIEAGYKCGCLTDFINPEDNEDLLEDFENNHWEFCGNPVVCNEYFDKYCSSLKFERLKRQIEYSKENPSCNCFWSEYSRKMHKIVSSIVWDIWELFDGFYEIAYSGSEEDEHRIVKEMFYADRKFLEHMFFCFSFDDIEESLNEFDPLVYNLYYKYTNVTLEKYEKWKTRMLNRARVAYLELCKECYSKHPHPRVSKEIEELTKLEDQENDEETYLSPSSNRSFESRRVKGALRKQAKL